jgi:hypothetical protein
MLSGKLGKVWRATMAERSGLIAKTALGISVASFGFSAFQWWNTEGESRITAAIEISKRFLEEPPKEYPEDQVERHKAIQIHARRITYIAYLMNQGRLDVRYVSPAIKCEIDTMWRAALALQYDPSTPYKIPTPDLGTAIRNMGPVNPCAVSTDLGAGVFRLKPLPQSN